MKQLVGLVILCAAASWASIGGADNYANNFIYFQSDYVRDPKFCWDPHIPTSESFLARLAAKLQPGEHFDVRSMAAVHSVLFLAFYYPLLLLLRPLSLVPRIALALIALWIFADTGTVALFNSYFADVAAILGGLAMTVLAVHLLKVDKIGHAALLVFGLAALLFVTSKTPHAIAGIVPLAFVAVLVFRSKDLAIRITAGVIAVALIAGMTWVLTTTPDWYLAQARFNLVFFKITPRDPAGAPQDLRQLGLGDADLRYVGLNAYMANSPMIDPKWADAFAARCTQSSVIGFYLHHPATALSFLWSDMSAGAERRQKNLSNFRREAGQPAGAQSYRFATWSLLRSWLFDLWPPHILIWYLFVLAALPVLAWRDPSRYRRAIAGVIAAISVMGAVEYALASLPDACETHRHMLLFHIFTDAAIFLVLVYAASRFERARAAAPQPS